MAITLPDDVVNEIETNLGPGRKLHCVIAVDSEFEIHDLMLPRHLAGVVKKHQLPDDHPHMAHKISDIKPMLVIKGDLTVPDVAQRGWIVIGGVKYC